MSEKTITVTDVHGRETRLSADGWGTSESGSLAILAGKTSVAQFAGAQWVSVIADTRRAPDSVRNALQIARNALRDIQATLRGTTSGSTAEQANKALDEIGERLEIALDGISGELDA